MKDVKMIEKYYDKHTTHIVYEYKNHKYEVEYANDVTYCITPAYIQHKDAQSKIDKMIEQENKKKTHKIEDTAEYGLDVFFNEYE